MCSHNTSNKRNVNEHIIKNNDRKQYNTTPYEKQYLY